MKYLLHAFIIIFFWFTTVCGATEKMNGLHELHDIKLKIIQIGDPLLRTVARPLTQEEILSPAIQQFILLMKNTMHDAPGVGLAAPQVGVPLQIIVIEDREEYLKFLKPEDIKARDRRPVPFQVLINPKITLLATEKQATFYEGCLSIEGLMGNVPRALTVKVEALNEKGAPVTLEAHGWYARILQHETDHLQGTLYIDRINGRALTTIENYKKFQG